MKIALIGYGKMGREIERIARSRGHEIVCIIDLDNQNDFTSEAFRSADVAIEFTSPQAAYGNYLRAFRAGFFRARTLRPPLPAGRGTAFHPGPSQGARVLGAHPAGGAHAGTAAG